MKKIPFIITALMLTQSLLAQPQNEGKLFEIVNSHLATFKQSFHSLEGKIFYVEVILDSGFISDTTNVIYVLHNLSHKKLGKSKDEFLVRYLISKEGQFTVVKAGNFQVKKKTKKHLMFINLGSGKKYYLRE
jgi:hypothetical protein